MRRPPTCASGSRCSSATRGVRSRRYTYFACSTRYKYGPSKCNGERLPKYRLEAAAQLTELYRDSRLIERALAAAVAQMAKERPRIEEQVASTRAEITRVERKLERYLEAFEAGELSAALPGTRPWPPSARAGSQPRPPARHRGARTPDAAALAGLADQLDEILAIETPSRRRNSLRLLVKEIRVDTSPA
jgi:hypothetical protein